MELAFSCSTSFAMIAASQILNAALHHVLFFWPSSQLTQGSTLVKRFITMFMGFVRGIFCMASHG